VLVKYSNHPIRRRKEEKSSGRAPSSAWSLIEGSDGVDAGLHLSILASEMRSKKYFL